MSFFSNIGAAMQGYQFWLVLLALYGIGYGLIYQFVKKIPVLNNRQMIIGISFIALLVTSGVFGTGIFGTASAGQRRVRISDVQVTTSFDGNCTNTLNSNNPDLLDVRCLGYEHNETATWYEVDSGILTVYREGDLSPVSCKVTATTNEGFTSEKTPGDGNRYTIVEETTLDELEVYLNPQKSGSGAAASTSSPKETTYLEFDEGASQAHLGILVELDSDAMQQLNQYSYKDIKINICNSKYFTIRAHQMS